MGKTKAKRDAAKRAAKMHNFGEKKVSEGKLTSDTFPFEKAEIIDLPSNRSKSDAEKVPYLLMHWAPTKEPLSVLAHLEASDLKRIFPFWAHLTDEEVYEVYYGLMKKADAVKTPQND